jgi:hypothetical protein
LDSDGDSEDSVVDSAADSEGGSAVDSAADSEEGSAVDFAVDSAVDSVADEEALVAVRKLKLMRSQF